jgi:lysophospholipase L1-like esterase
VAGPGAVQCGVTDLEFSYSNVSDRRAGPLLRIARRVVPGFGEVGAQVLPYAQEWRRRNLEALPGTGPLWVVLGDSLSQGIGASSVDAGWVPRVLAQLPGDVRVVNLSVSGARTQELIDRQLPVLAALGVEPAVVTVMIGSNDMIRRRYRDALPDRFADLLQRVPAGSLVATMPDVDRPLATVLNGLAADAAGRGIVGVPYAGGRGNRAADRFHPNDEGYRGMAAPWVPAVSAALDRRVTRS